MIKNSTVFKKLLLASCVISIGFFSSCADKQEQENKPNARLTYWVNLAEPVERLAGSLNNTPFAHELREKTGIDINFIHPPAGQETSQLNIMLLSGSLPDIIEYYWPDFPGGVDRAVTDGYILRLNDIIEESAPNFKAFLSEHEDIDKMIRTDSGNYVMFPFVREDKSLFFPCGPIIRRDWLDRLSLPVPETIEEWEKTLRAFKDRLGAEAPLALSLGSIKRGAFTGAYQTSFSFIVKDNQIKYGPAEPGFYDYLELFSNWYREGLIDPSFANIGEDSVSSKIKTGQGGAAVEFAGYSMGEWLNEMEGVDGYDLAPARFPVLNKGEMPRFGYSDGPYSKYGAAAITMSCKNVPLAVKLLDYGYSKEGQMVYNFGKENESYVMKDGHPIYTEKITNNPEYSMKNMMFLYIKGNTQGPFVQMKEYIQQYYNKQQLKDTITTWENDSTHILPPLTFIKQESDEISVLMPAIQDYTDQMAIKFIMGIESLEYYPEFIQALDEMGLDAVLDIYQEAYERYLSR